MQSLTLHVPDPIFPNLSASERSGFLYDYRLFPFLVRLCFKVCFNKALAKSTLVPDYISSSCQADTAHTNYTLAKSEILRFNNSASVIQELASLLLLNIVQFTK